MAAQAMGTVDQVTRAIVPPIHVSTTFVRDPDNAYSSGFVYGRPDNQTVREAEAIVAMLEQASAALVFSSGMSAALAVFQSLAMGDHIIAPKIMYWALRSWLRTEAVQRGLTLTLVDATDLDAVRAAVVPGKTRIIWIETPANPLWDVTDIGALATIAHHAGARLAVEFDMCLARAHPAAEARGRHRHACRHKIPQRALRRGRRCPRLRAPG